MRKIFIILGALLQFMTPCLNGQEMTNVRGQDIELGLVTWHRNYDEAINLSISENKPLLILFQEVPGCSTCRNYGKNVLSNPLMVEAIENLFVPLVIHNNKGGEDKRILEKFNEPTWNNPVVRIVNGAGEDLIDRINRDYSAVGLYEAMKKVLTNADEFSQNKRDIVLPEYFNILGQELSINERRKEAYFKMYCFWSGERHLGSAEGVLTTEAGFMGGHEVVKVEYDPEFISEEALVDFAEEEQCSAITPSDDYKVAKKDLKYSLQQTKYKFIPLSPIQQTKINSAISSKIDPVIYLSPKQVLWLQEINADNKKLDNLLQEDFEVSWKKKVILTNQK